MARYPRGVVVHMSSQGLPLDAAQSRELYIAMTTRTLDVIRYFTTGCIWSETGWKELEQFAVDADQYVTVLAGTIASEIFERLFEEGWVSSFVEPSQGGEDGAL